MSHSKANSGMICNSQLGYLLLTVVRLAVLGLYSVMGARWLGHVGLCKWMRGVSSLPTPRKEIKSICLTIHKVWKQAVLAI